MHGDNGEVDTSPDPARSLERAFSSPALWQASCGDGSVLLQKASAGDVERLLEASVMDAREEGYCAVQGHEAVPRRAKSEPSCRDQESKEPVGPESFTFVRRLGKGTFGEVFQVKHKKSHQDYAIKVLPKRHALEGNFRRYTVTERNLLSWVRHPYIVHLHYAFQTDQHLALVLQLCTRGSVQTLIDAERRLEEPLARLYTAEMLLGLIHLHESNIIFRDLKPDNVVIDEEGHAMLTDFGLAKEDVAAQEAHSFCGSPAYLAPEVLKRSGHGRAVDIYGLGVFLFSMLAGMPPFYDPDREVLFHNIRLAELRVPPWASTSAALLMEDLLRRDPEQRIGAECTSDVMEHDFFIGMDWEALLLRKVPVPPPLPPLFSGYRPPDEKDRRRKWGGDAAPPKLLPCGLPVSLSAAKTRSGLFCLRRRRSGRDGRCAAEVSKLSDWEFETVTEMREVVGAGGA